MRKSIDIQKTSNRHSALSDTNQPKAKPISTASNGKTLDAPLTIGVPTREEDGVGEISPMPVRRGGQHLAPRTPKSRPSCGPESAVARDPVPHPIIRNSGGCRGPRPTPHQPQQRRLLGTPSRDGDDTARIVSIAFPADSLQVPCLFGLAPVFMRVLCRGKIHCYFH